MADKPTDKRADDRRLIRPVAGVLIGLYALFFAILNFDRVEVNWVFFTRDSRLIYVVLVAFVLGGLTDRFLLRRRDRK
jgi:uncharacterized integral membrane protein